MLKRAGGKVFLRRSLAVRLGLLAFAVFFLLLPGRASIPPFDRDEPRYMQATAQMLESGNFVDVRFQDKPRYLQPAGIYWLEAAAVSLSGTLRQREIWAYRVPSLLAMTAAVVLTARMGALLFTPAAGLMAGVLLGTSVLVTAEGRMATIDSTLLLVVVLVQAVLLRVLRDRAAGRPTPVWTAVLFWGALGCGLMLKGPVILIPGLGTPLAFAFVEREWSWLKRLRPGWGWLVMLAVVLPWCIAIGVVSHGEFFQRAVGRNFLGKIGHGQEAHGAFPGYHLAVFAIAFWPGSFFAAAAIPVIWSWRASWKVRFLLCWIVPHWLVFELIATKLPHYVLPAYPAIAILTAAALQAAGNEWTFWRRSVWGRILLGFYGVVCAAIGIALSVAGIALTKVLVGQIPVSAWLAAGGSLPLLALAVREVVRGRLWQSAMCSAACAVVIYMGLFLGIVPRLDEIWLAPRIADLVDEYRPCPATEVVSSSFSEPSLVFLMHGKVELRNAREGAAMLSRNPSCGLVLVDRRDFATFREALSGKGVHEVEYGRVSGFNYSTGKWLDLGLYGAASP
ncbi:phospholipid carrier-dependent glycosyltransferase [Acetobacter musti]|uniref:Phospholipid carrier-dependent glycosyltransferase n=1 Tax=Acetobacter musti TaxID=864732 RepID=A0ABX0JTJ6_9PROT|nr:glycosyltransferase family 39 protein [Acetobacter musti]NHN85855.1 phospholipid carrier-dependent glycosyltransferase [Acetobacter musti]